MVLDIFVLMIVLGVLTLIAWSFIDILRSDFSGVEKPIWLILVWIMPIVGAALYMAIGRKRKSG